MSFSSLTYSQSVNVLDPTQVYTTPNITNNTTSPTSTTGTWQNVGLWNQGLPCWGPGGPVYCGPNPYFNNGSFNFSYGLTDVYQVVNIANALPNSGTGLRVNGYNFTFIAKNGNGWDNGQTDYLSAYVNFYGSDGKQVRSDYYNLNYKFDWTMFGYSKTFDTPFASKDLSTVRYGFVGGDSNFWAGPYGPEIYNIGFSLKYSVDPCYTNVLYSPSCPGYMDALNKLTALPTTTNVTTVEINSTLSTTPAPSPATTTTVASTTSNGTNIVSFAPIVPTTTNAPSNSTRTVDGTSIGLSIVARNQQREQAIAMQASQTAIQLATEASTQAQQEAVNVASQSSANSIAMAQTTTKSTTNTTEVKTVANNTDLTFQNNQSTSALTMFASPTTTSTQKQTESQQTFVAATTTMVQNSRPTQSNQQVESTVSSDRVNNTGLMNNVVSSVEVDIKPQTTVAQAKSTDTSTVSNAPTEIVAQQVQPTYSLLPPVVSVAMQTTTPQSYKLVQDKETSVTEREKVQEIVYNPTIASYTLLPPRQEMSQTNTQPVIATAIQNTTMTFSNSQPVMQVTNDFSMSDSQKMLLDRSNPLFQTLENKNIETQNTMISQQGPTVNRNVQNNEVAGGVDINRMAQAPAGYNEYLNFTLRDAAFYAPKEVYRNQKVIDNARALRQLSSDRLHQQMVNSQYERK